jgi:hypothetical protein
MIEWTCLGHGPQHPADIQWVETLRKYGNSHVEIHRCRTCGQIYRYHTHEINDWGRFGDFCDTTYVWQPLAPDEVEALRQDVTYRPRAGTEFAHSTGWKRG